MKKLLLTVFIVSIPLMGCPKEPINGEFTQLVRDLEIPGADENLKNLMLDIATEIDRCSQNPEGCENLPDPWKDSKMQTFPRQIETVKNDPDSGKVQVLMAHFENEMLNEKAGPMLNKSNAFTTFSYYAGFGIENIKKRMRKYVETIKGN